MSAIDPLLTLGPRPNCAFLVVRGRFGGAQKQPFVRDRTAWLPSVRSGRQAGTRVDVEIRDSKPCYTGIPFHRRTDLAARRPEGLYS